MITAESTHVLDPECRSFHWTLRLIPEDFGRLRDAFFVRLVLQNFVDVVEQLVSRELVQIHRQTVTFVIKTPRIVDLVSVHRYRKADHRNSVVNCLKLPIVSTVGNEEFDGSMCKNVILR